MSAVAASTQATEHRSPTPGTLEIGIGALAILHVGLGLLMAVSPTPEGGSP
ncbi:MAG: hypothetical protein ACLQBY_00895 [Solirubrobacteraceae bacterium]